MTGGKWCVCLDCLAKSNSYDRDPCCLTTLPLHYGWIIFSFSNIVPVFLALILIKINLSTGNMLFMINTVIYFRGPHTKSNDFIHYKTTFLSNECFKPDLGQQIPPHQAGTAQLFWADALLLFVCTCITVQPVCAFCAEYQGLPNDVCVDKQVVACFYGHEKPSTALFGV